jgi:pre-mRNA-processing factor 17
MNQIQYDSSDSDSQPISKKIKTSEVAPTKMTMVVAPSVPDVIKKPAFYATGNTKEITINVPLKDMNKPVQGPKNPFQVERQGNRNMMSGFVEAHHMNDQTFNSLNRTFNTLGYTLDPDARSSNDFIGDKEALLKNNSKLIERIKTKPKERESRGNVDDETFKGPWASFVGENIMIEPRMEPYKETTIPQFDAKKLTEEIVQTTEKSIFHGTEQRDYLGRSFLHPPTDVDLRSSGKQTENFIPKTLYHTWTGHTKGVNTIKWFPKSAHMILSGSMDCKIKIWDCYNEKQVKRTYIGHSKGVKDLSFTNDGTQFLSASYDKHMKLWDTETGQCISRYTTKKIPFCITFNPSPEHQNSFLVGCEDKKIYQFDKRTGQVELEYDAHSGGVNTITFIDDNKRFCTTSDDKSLRCWEFGVPIVIKYVSEPDMHSMPAVTLSDNQKWLACQSLDNKIVIFSALDRLR